MDTTRLVEIDGGYHVWTRRVGEGPIKLLTLHGGPGASHEYFECLEQFLPRHGIEFYYYDQLGSYYSDQPDDPSLWTVERFREEVETVRRAWGLEDFYLFGQSWGGMLAIEYALKYQEHLRALVVSNMAASIPSYVRHINELRSRLPREIVDRMLACEAAGDVENPEYQELVQEHLYRYYICRLWPWPDAVVRTFAHISAPVYNTMQGPNEFLVTGPFSAWDRWADLGQIRVPTILLVGRHDTMDPEDIIEMGRRIPRSRVGVCERGSHLSCWDDQESYFGHLVAFLQDMAAGRPVQR